LLPFNHIEDAFCEFYVEFNQMNRPAALTVSQLNGAVRELIEQSFGALAVTGELSNVTRASSGHWYFTLKDDDAQVRCTFFRLAAQRSGFTPVNGQKVDVWARVSLYEARGDYQLNIEAMRPAGEGDRHAAFARLKAQLEAEGLFASERKRALPAMPRGIGIVTSLAGAALQDVLATLERRAPMIPIEIYPTSVQGDSAPAEIVQALRLAYRSRSIDVLIVCRGGGSAEDLWAFNDEALARAIAAFNVPVISGVGHETDFTLCDFVADHRAATPTAAAVLASPDREQLLADVSGAYNTLQRDFERQLQSRMQLLDTLSARLPTPGARLQMSQASLRALAQRQQFSLQRFFSEKRNQHARLSERLQRRVDRLRPTVDTAWLAVIQQQQRLQQSTVATLTQRKQQLALLQTKLDLLSPLAVLNRGYALALDAEGSPIATAERARQSQTFALRFSDDVVQVEMQK
jgi:exodeoxyribonuclease VII large subunit